MRRYLIMALLLFSVALYSATHEFHSWPDNTIIYTTQQLLEQGNIAVDPDGWSFNVFRWEIGYTVRVHAFGDAWDISENDFISAVQNAVNEYDSNISSTSIYGINIVYDPSHEDAIEFTFSEDIEDFDVPLEHAAEAEVSRSNLNEILPDGTSVLFNNSPEFLNHQGLNGWFYGFPGVGNFICVETIALHEMGHVLGVDHIYGGQTNFANTIMYPNFEPNITLNSLSNKDINSLQAIYETEGATDCGDVISIDTYISNHPNPFNPSTTISYSLADNIKNPKIEIYNIKGQLVRALELPEEQGANTVNWDGRNKQDNPVSSGVYLYRLVNNGKAVQSRKMMMLK